MSADFPFVFDSAMKILPIDFIYRQRHKPVCKQYPAPLFEILGKMRIVDRYHLSFRFFAGEKNNFFAMDKKTRFIRNPAQPYFRPAKIL